MARNPLTSQRAFHLGGAGGLEDRETGRGGCLGDQLAVGSARDDIDIVAEPGLRIVALDPAAVADLLDHSPTLAAEIGDALEARRQAARAVAQAI